MRRLYRLLPGLLLMVGVVGLAAAKDYSDVVGAWRLNGTDEAGGSRSAVIYIMESDGKLDGRWNTGGRSTELRDVRYDNGRLTFWFYMDIKKSLIKLYFGARIDGDTFKGKLREPHMTGEVTGARIKVKSEPAQ